ncbi:MAG TPA: 16S rRNA (cytidine(1402)-2'-O)-methyltransferase, partial [Burkholderiales bacterium]|nr:16S rRNA (cytidine(1402)-2'-O)-methyltransferase [Burkholderiales bacterium]
TARLLNHYGIVGKKLVPLHQHNEQRSAPAVIAALAAGMSVALASDAGTPAFSDPGARLVEAVRVAGFPVVPIPGANAAAAALSASGLADTHFLFYGFLPAKRAERLREIETLASAPWILVFYEAPHRIVESVSDLAQKLGGARRIVIARELTKIFEAIHVCPLQDAVTWITADPDRMRGEFVLLVEGAPPDDDAVRTAARRVLAILLEELPVKQAAALAARITGARKNELYARALEMKATHPVSD